MLSDLAALTPPLLVCVVFLLGVRAFLRHEMGDRRKDAAEGVRESELPPNLPQAGEAASRQGAAEDVSNQDSGAEGEQ